MKKRLLSLFVFIPMVAMAQIVDIPDANFKAKLLQLNIDTNADGNIQETEAAAVENLEIPAAGIVSLTGIQAFTNIHLLDVRYNNLVSLDLSGMTNLKYLIVSENHELASINLTGLDSLEQYTGDYLTALTSLDISMLSSLKSFHAHNTGLMAITVGNLPQIETFTLNYSINLTSLDVSGLANVKYLDCFGNAIGALDLTLLVNLLDLDCGGNLFTQINTSTMIHLTRLAIWYSQITSIDLSHLTELKALLVGNNALTSLDLSVVAQLEQFDFGSGPLTSLDLSPLVNLTFLSIDSPQITNLDITPLAVLDRLYVHNLPQADLDLTHQVVLSYLEIASSGLQSADLSHSNAVMSNIAFYSCTNLQFINIKNGTPTSQEFRVSYCPALLQICKDPADANFNFDNSSNPQIGDYCSFTPGGNYNTIAGDFHYDADSDGCGAGDGVLPLFKVQLSQGANTSATFTDALGNYKFYTGIGTLAVTPILENPAYFTISPANTTVTFANANFNTETKDFCLSPNGIHNDVEVVLVPIGGARPGFDADYKLIYKNKGNQIQSGTVAFTYLEDVLDLVASVPSPDLQTLGNLSYDFSNLLPFETREIDIKLNVNSPAETPAVNINDVLNFNAVVDLSEDTDETPEDNEAAFNQTVIGSFDPNDKQCMEGSVTSTSKIGDYLHYVINFENTGTAEAINVVVKDMIDTTKFDLGSLQVLSTSHNCYLRITSNKVEFIFEGISLQASEHGNVVFKIKTKATLVAGNTVNNKADIFFDYNLPVVTDTFYTTFQNLGVGEQVLDASISIYPNPAGSIVNVKADHAIKSMAVYDLQGRLLEVKMVQDQTASLDISGKQNGMYFLKVVTENGTKIEKLLKN